MNISIQRYLFAASVFLLFAFTQQTSNRYFEISKNLEIFASLYKEVNEYYVDEVNPNQLMETGIAAMLASLDPYTNYISENRIEEFRTERSGQYAGFGATITNFNGQQTIIMLAEGYPAMEQGVKIGDVITHVDGIELEPLQDYEVEQLLRGQARSKVTLTIKRYGSPAPLNIELIREKVKIESVPYTTMINENTGYLKLSEFFMNAGRDVKKGMQKLLAEGAEKIIFDLRDNPGGLLVEAVNITNLFIPKGEEVVTIRGKVEENNATYRSLNNPLDTDIPVAILINSGSASASEIVSGTLQDYDRAVIVGEKSYGKGLVQQTRPLSYNSQLKVTTAKYYTPSGRCIQALDYSHRNSDGSVGKVPDSLIQSFQTRNGRTVYDGGGIDPDVKIEKPAIPKIAEALVYNGHIFNYATQFYYEHADVPAPSEFEITEEIYSDFLNWVEDKEYTYETAVEKELIRLEKMAVRERYYTEIEDHLNALKAKLNQRKKKDLIAFKAIISQYLKEEIVGRYYLEKGVLLSSFSDDKDIQESIKILDNPTAYKKILNPN